MNTQILTAQYEEVSYTFADAIHPMLWISKALELPSQKSNVLLYYTSKSHQGVSLAVFIYCYDNKMRNVFLISAVMEYKMGAKTNMMVCCSNSEHLF